jgi:aspartyl-tRNA(Asn)/glutamyl-tRNA(Gln) amidotransferase subunit A
MPHRKPVKKMQPGPKFTTLRIRDLSDLIACGDVSPLEMASDAVLCASALRGSNCWRHFDPDDVLAQGERQTKEPRGGDIARLRGIPVSVKDLFDVAAQPTTCGSRSFGAGEPRPQDDAVFVRLWRERGALLAGKTHLNEFAYGITGENPWFGDCTIPGRPDRLTGGSSSGAAASVVGGAACIGLGTDTGGSLRVPAALCGLVSFRSRDLFPDHQGTFPLARSFDTLGWLNRHLDDVGFVAAALFGDAMKPSAGSTFPTLVFPEGPMLEDCDVDVLAALKAFRELLREAGAPVVSCAADGWEAALDLFAPVQANEAFAVHRSRFKKDPDQYSPAVRARLESGERISEAEVAGLHERIGRLVAHMEGAFDQGPLLVLPAASVSCLRCGDDHAATRSRLLRLTTPASLGCWPVLTIPWRPEGEATGVGFQIIARRGDERRLIAFAGLLASRAGCF